MKIGTPPNVTYCTPKPDLEKTDAIALEEGNTPPPPQGLHDVLVLEKSSPAVDQIATDSRPQGALMSITSPTSCQ